MGEGSEVFYTLEKNYRNSEQVIEFANRILHLKNYCFASEDKMTEKEKELFFMESETGDTGNVGFIAKDKEQEIAERVHKSVNWAVLVLNDKSKEDARKLFKTPLVFNIHEAKGLEFENVILYKFTSHKAYNEIWNIVCPDKSEGEIDNTINRIRDSYNEREVNTSRNKDKKDKSLEKYKFYMNALYVGVTRAVDSVYIIDDESNLLKIIEPREEGNVNIEQEESSPEEWRNKALELIEKGNIEQAELIARKLQNEGKKEYAEEIMNVLRAKGYHKELQNNKHTNSVLEKESTNKYINPQDNEEDSKRIEKNGELLNVICKDNITQFKRMDISQYSEEEIFILALEKNSFKIIELLIKNKDASKNSNFLAGKENIIFLQAVEKGCTSLVKFLLESKKADVNAKFMQNMTSLHIASYGGKRNVVKLLLNHGADVNAKNASDNTPLHLAVKKGSYDIVKLLLYYEAEVDTEDQTKATPLHWAAAIGYKSIVELLLYYGAEINAKISQEGYTPLNAAVAGGHYGIVALFLKKGADIHTKATGESGYTSLHFAVGKNCCPDIVKLLLHYGAEVNTKDAL